MRKHESQRCTATKQLTWWTLLLCVVIYFHNHSLNQNHDSSQIHSILQYRSSHPVNRNNQTHDPSLLYSNDSTIMINKICKHIFQHNAHCCFNHDGHIYKVNVAIMVSVHMCKDTSFRCHLSTYAWCQQCFTNTSITLDKNLI